MSVAWNTSALPTENLYGKVTGYVDNEIKTEYDSGRITACKKNTVQRRIFSVNYAAKSKVQERAFDQWFRFTLGGIAQEFTAPSLDGDGTTATYKMTQNPELEGIGIKKIKMQWQEV